LLPGVLRAVVADHRFVDVEPAVDHVEQHGLAGDDVDDRRLERPVAGDDVDLAGRGGGPGRDRRGRRRRARVAGGDDREGSEQSDRANNASRIRTAGV
jgi:hypothetical protein